MEQLKILVERTQSGDLDAYTTIVQRFQDMALGYAYSLLGDFHLAEDAAQEAFIQAFLDLPKLSNPVAFPGWFRRIVFKHSDRILRKRRMPLVSPEATDEIPSEQKDPAAVVEEQELKRQLYSAIQALPEREREITMLFYISEYSHKEIASFLEVSRATVDNRLRASRKKLKERMFAMAEKTLREEAPSKDEQFIRDVMNRLQAIQELHNAFLHSLASTFSEVLKRKVDVDTAFVDLTTYAEVVKAISLFPSCTYTVTMEPLNGDAIFTLYAPIVHSLLGSAEAEARPLKKEEVNQMEPVATQVLKDLEAIWKSHGVTLKNPMVETDPELIGLASPGDLMIIIGIEINVEGYAREDLNPKGPRGIIRPAACLCYPLSTLGSILPTFEAA